MGDLVSNANIFVGDLIRNILTPLVLPIVERNMVPDAILRLGIRRELEMELAKVSTLSVEEKAEKLVKFISEIKKLPIAIKTNLANDQHYEVPDEFFKLMLGPNLKYSCGYWPHATTTLEGSELYMLEMYCQRAQIEDGMTIVDLGCGWGSVTLYVAKKFPKCKVTGISNSNSQREYILATAKARGLSNVNVLTGDINEFDLPKEEYYGKADRVISIEMFEHMKNYELLMAKINNWIKPGGKLFVHIFTHKDVPGHYESGWMTDNFFSGGTLPSDSLLLYFQQDMQIEGHWRVSGTHYQRTLEAWLKRMDELKSTILPVLGSAYGQRNALKWFVNWRLFNMGCAEFFGMRNGQEYIVSHYLFAKPAAPKAHVDFTE